MKVSRAFRRYARAIFSASLASGNPRSVCDELAATSRLLASRPDLQGLLVHPRVGGDVKTAAVNKAFAGRVEETTLLVLLLLTRRNRFRAFPEIVSALEELVLVHEGVQRARISTAIPLTEDERRMIVSRLEKLTGKKILAEFGVDHSLIGGIVISLGDHLIDGSVRWHLEKMKTMLKSIRIA